MLHLLSDKLLFRNVQIYFVLNIKQVFFLSPVFAIFARRDAPCAHSSIDRMNTSGCVLTICSFSPPGIRVFGRRAGTVRKERSHTRLAKIRMSRNSLQTCPFDGTRDTPGAETRPAGKPVGGFRRQNDTGYVSGKKFQRERKNASGAATKRFLYRNFFIRAPKNKFRAPEFFFRGSKFRVPTPKFLVRLLQKVNDSDKTLHRSPALCKKIAQKSAIWAGFRKSLVTKISQNGTICLFSQTFHDFLTSHIYSL